MKTGSWWDIIPEDDGERVSIEIEAPPEFYHPCGFIRLRERHRVKATSYRTGKAAEQQEA